MESRIRNRSRICPVPPGFKKGLNLHLRSRTIFMAVSLTFILTATGLVYYWMLPIQLPPPLPTTPHGAIAIDGDANFSDTALLEGWPGDGSPENPYTINRMDIDLGGVDDILHCIMIINTRVRFTISNCNLTGATGYWGMGNLGCGISLENVTNGELVNNTCTSNGRGISLGGDYNTVANNTCTSNGFGISLGGDYNTVANNTCTSNGDGIHLYDSSFNTVTNNMCNSNDVGIEFDESDSNTVTDNTCNNNSVGIHLYDSSFNTVTNNMCNSNDVGIEFDESDSNTVANNNIISKEFGTVVLLLIGVAGVMMLGAGWRMAKLSRGESKGGGEQCHLLQTSR